MQRIVQATLLPWLLLPLICDGPAEAQVMLSPAFQEANQAAVAVNREPAIKAIRLHAAGEPDPALRYRFWPAVRDRRNASPHPFVSRALLLATQAAAEARARDLNFVTSYERISDLPLDRVASDEVRQFLDQYGTTALTQLSEIDCLMDTTYDLQIEGRSLSEIVNILLPEVQESRQLARLLAVRARLAIAEKRWDDLVTDVRTGFRLSEIIGDLGPTLTSKLVGNAIASVMLAVVGEAIQQPECPNLYWALASVQGQNLFQVDEAIELEISNIVNVLDVGKHQRIAGDADEARYRLIFMVEQIGQLDSDSSGRGLAAPIARLIAGLYVVAMAEPSRDLLAASAEHAGDVTALSISETVLRATQLRLVRTRDDWLKWMILPAELEIDLEEKLWANRLDLRTADAASIIGWGTFLPLLQASRTASQRPIQQYHLWMTMEAMRMHAADSGELPQSLDQLHPVPALHDSIARGPFLYQRTSATTATLTHAQRWSGDREATMSIELIRNESR